MTDLDLRRLRYFVTLAGTLNYGRAAEVLHLAQPALSRAIAGLERDLGVRLFDRSRSGTRLTAAGELLHEEARDLLASAGALQRRVRLAGREGHALTIGFMPGLILTPLIRHLAERFPGLSVDVVRTSWTEQITGLHTGRFDASLAHRPFDDDGLTVTDLWTEPRVVALPADHRHAGRTDLTVADLAGELLIQPAAAVPGWPGAVAFRPAGGDASRAMSPAERDASRPVSPAERDASPTVEEKFERVAAGRGIVIVAESAGRYYRRPDLTFARVADLPPAEICLVVESRRRSPVLRELPAIARATLTPHADAASVGT